MRALAGSTRVQVRYGALGLQDGRYCYRVPLQQRLIRQDAPGIRLRQEVAIQNGS